MNTHKQETGTAHGGVPLDEPQPVDASSRLVSVRAVCRKCGDDSGDGRADEAFDWLESHPCTTVTVLPRGEGEG